MRRKNIILIAILALLIGITAVAHNYNATEMPETPDATATPTPTVTATPPRVVGGGFAINDSIVPPPRTPVPEPSGDPVILSLQGPETAIIGDTFTIKIKVNPNGKNVNGIQAELRFDQKLFQVNSIEMGNEVNKDFSIPPVVNNEQGAIENIAGMSSLALFPAEEFIFAVITLTAKEPGTAKLRLERNVATYASGADTPILMPTKAEVKNIIIK